MLPVRSPILDTSLRWPSLLALLAPAVLLLGSSAASAQSFWWDYPPDGYYKRKRSYSAPSRASERRRSRESSEERSSSRKDTEKDKEKSKAVAAPNSQLLTVVTISDQKVRVYDSTGEIDHGGVSTGQAGHRTPTGIFSIIQKNRWHHSNIYSGAPMPYMQRITWSGVAMHQGVLPGYPASHGCIRLSQSFAQTHFGRTKLGMRVVVSPEPTTAVAFSHAKLPAPAFTAAPSKVTDTQPAGSEGLAGGQLVKIASSEGDAGASTQPPVKMLSPMDRALAAKTQAAANVKISADAAKVALETAAERSAAAQAALSDLRGAEIALAAARTQLEEASRAAAAAAPDAAETAKAAKAEAESRLAAAEKALAGARAAEDARRTDAFAAASAAREAERAAELAIETAKGSSKWTEPVSVFISKKEGRVFVRQGFAPILDAPVTISEPGTPIGTHLYVALATGEDGRSLAWKAVTVPNSGLASPESTSGKRGKKSELDEDKQTQRPHETAAGALDRVTLPEDVQKLLADKLWPGASLIISDYGTSYEQGEGATTDFIVLTR